MGLVLLLAARVWAIQGKKERGEVDCCGMEGGLGSIWRMQYLGLSTAMLADVCLVSEFAVFNLTAGLEMQRLVSIDNTYSSSTYCFWRNGKSRSQRLRRVYWTRTVASLAPTKKKDDGCTILCDLVPFTL